MKLLFEGQNFCQQPLLPFSQNPLTVVGKLPLSSVEKMVQMQVDHVVNSSGIVYDQWHYTNEK